MDLNNIVSIAMEAKKVSDFNKFVKLVAMDSYLSVRKCWWDNIEFDCNGAFSNQFFDSKLCFTFNPNVELISLVQTGIHIQELYILCFIKINFKVNIVLRFEAKYFP